MKNNQKIALYILIFASIIIILSASEFVNQWEPDTIVPEGGVQKSLN